jgi:hypothetical protein
MTSATMGERDDGEEEAGNGHEPGMNGKGRPEGDETNGAASPLDLQMPPREPPPPEVAELAASCVRFVLAKYKVPLDFTPDTLGVLDHYVKEARAELTTRPEGQALLEASIGAYFGEVVRGLFESTWRTAGEYTEWRLSMSEVYLTFNPLGMAREALVQDDAPGWHSHLGMHTGEEEEVARRLASLPEVAEDEYYALSTRFDVIELAVEALRARSRRP